MGQSNFFWILNYHAVSLFVFPTFIKGLHLLLLLHVNSWWVSLPLYDVANWVSVLSIPSKEFMLQKGITQGDLLAPFLLTITTKGLSDLMREVVSKNQYKGFKVGTKEVEVNLL